MIFSLRTAPHAGAVLLVAFHLPRNKDMQAAFDLQQLGNAIGDAIVVCDASGAIILWNPGAERIFGFTEQEALGQSLDLIIPERLRKRHWDGYHKSMETGETRYGNDLLKVPTVHKDGRKLSIAGAGAGRGAAGGRGSARAAV